MKTKLTLFIISLSAFVFFMVLSHFNRNSIEIPTKAGANIKACNSSDFILTEIDSTRQIAPVIDHLGDHQMKISTQQAEAQSFFNQGLNLAFAFNHAESHRSFLEVSRLDPKAAMAFWGQAYVLGPNINDQIPDTERRIKALEAIQKAQEKSAGASEFERDLINALKSRYSKDTLSDISQLNIDYMNSMAELLEKYPDHTDVLTLYAAAVMNTSPWDYWDKEGKPNKNIREAKQALEKAMMIDPKHPGANHYYIHMVELPKPDLGVPSAEKLADIMPGAGHMVHMPGHIYMRVGRYKEAVVANQKAIEVDEDYISQCYAQGIYPLGYYPHNIHFLWSAASMMGNQELAVDAARKTAEKVPYNGLEGNRFYQNFASTPLLVYLRFGKWNEILSTPDPGEEYDYLRMIRSYARGIAFLRKNNLKEAREELEFLKNRDQSLEFENISQVAYQVLSGEIQAFQGNWDKADKEFQLAVKFEDELPYDEPAVWYIPTRQSYGAVLLKAKKYKKAEIVYREDLAYYRQNGWSLKGLMLSLEGQNKSKEADSVRTQFNQAWKDADVLIESSVF